MTSDELKPSLLFLWANYEHQNDGIIKDRYFLFLGGTNDMISTNSHYYLVTGTSLCGYYNRGGDREKSCHMRFKVLTHDLPAETVFDFDLHFCLHYKNTIKESLSSMTKIAQFTHEELATIYNKLILSDKITHDAKCNIQSGLSQLGIPNLNSVAKKRKKKY